MNKDYSLYDVPNFFEESTDPASKVTEADIMDSNRRVSGPVSTRANEDYGLPDNASVRTIRKMGEKYTKKFNEGEKAGKIKREIKEELLKEFSGKFDLEDRTLTEQRCIEKLVALIYRYALDHSDDVEESVNTQDEINFYESYRDYMDDASNVLRNLTPTQLQAVVESAMKNGYDPYAGSETYSEKLHMEGFGRKCADVKLDETKQLKKDVSGLGNSNQTVSKEEMKARMISIMHPDNETEDTHDTANVHTDLAGNKLDAVFAPDADLDGKTVQSLEIVMMGQQKLCLDNKRQLKAVRSLVNKLMKKLDKGEELKDVQDAFKDEIINGSMKKILSERIENYGRGADSITRRAMEKEVLKYLSDYSNAVTKKNDSTKTESTIDHSYNEDFNGTTRPNGEVMFPELIGKYGIDNQFLKEMIYPAFVKKYKLKSHDQVDQIRSIVNSCRQYYLDGGNPASVSRMITMELENLFREWMRADPYYNDPTVRSWLKEIIRLANGKVIRYYSKLNKV